MTGRKNHNMEIFNLAADTLRGQGYTVFNPADIQDLTQNVAYKDYLKPEIEILLDIKKAVIVLPGWEEGVGCRLEVAVAAAIGLPVREFDQTEGLGSYVFSSDAGRDAVAQIVGGRNPLDNMMADENNFERPHEEAARIVLGPRGEFYDHPLDNFNRTALIWSGILYSKLLPETVLSAEDVALCMQGVKVAREAFRHKRDNITDGHGYWMTLEMLLTEKQRRTEQENKSETLSLNEKEKSSKSDKNK
jgi:hypothetical protein